MSLRLLSLCALVALTSTASAGQVAMRATGTISSLSVGGASPFAGQGLASGQSVTVYWEVNTPGTPSSPGLESYAIDQPTFLMTMGPITRTLGSPASILMQNQGTDGVRLFSAPLTGGGTLAFEFGDCNGLTFTSTDPLTNLVSLSGQFYCSYSFMVTGPGTFIDIDPLTFESFLPSTGTLFCYGDGTGTACPCANSSPTSAGAGCLSSLAVGGTLRAIGVPSVSADTITLQGAQIPNGPGLYFQGTTQLPVGNPGAGVTFGDGLRCAGGTIIRLGVVTAAGNASTYPFGATPPNNVPVSIKGLVTPGSSLHYQLWYRDSAAFCTASVFNLTNGLTLPWGS